jgi:hypothetical protein
MSKLALMHYDLKSPKDFKQEESVVSHEMVQTGSDFSSIQPKNRRAKRLAKPKKLKNCCIR